MSMSGIIDCCDRSIKRRLQQGKRKKFYQTIRRIIFLSLVLLLFWFVRDLIGLVIFNCLGLALICLMGIVIIRYLIIANRVRQVVRDQYPADKAMSLTLKMEGIRV